MKIFRTVILVLLILMSLAAGAAKIMRMPQEVEFFATAGLGVSLVVLLGILQVAGGALSAIPKTRKPGAALLATGFLASAVVILMTGNIIFAMISLVPVALAGVLFK